MSDVQDRAQVAGPRSTAKATGRMQSEVPGRAAELRRTSGAGLVAALGLVAGLLASAAPAGALALPVEDGHTFALPLPGLTQGPPGAEVDVEGASSLFFGLTAFPISGGAVAGPGGFFPFTGTTGTFEHDGSSVLFSRGESRVAFRDPVVDTLSLGVRADVELFSGGSLVGTLAGQRVFDLSPLGLSGLPLAFPLGPDGFDHGLPTVFDAFGREILLDLLRASFSFESEAILSEALFGGEPLDLAGRSAALLGVVAEIGEPVPEPGVALLVALGGLAAFTHRRHRQGPRRGRR